MVMSCRIRTMPAHMAVTHAVNIGCTDDTCHASTTNTKPQLVFVVDVLHSDLDDFDTAFGVQLVDDR
jgi:hypothetical protein